jgi:hypothetical protein
LEGFGERRDQSLHFGLVVQGTYIKKRLVFRTVQKMTLECTFAKKTVLQEGLAERAASAGAPTMSEKHQIPPYVDLQVIA